jgi:outer membrane protein/adhesin transport system outer membrane protein
VAGIARAENEVLAERARLRAREQEVLLAAATAYMDVWRDQAALAVNLDNEQVLERQLTATRDRQAGGDATRTDVSQAESRLPAPRPRGRPPRASCGPAGRSSWRWWDSRPVRN